MNFIDIYNGIIGQFQYFAKINFCDEKIFRKRLEICLKCNNIDIKPNNKYKCKLCGCNLNKKLILKRSKCRKNYW